MKSSGRQQVEPVTEGAGNDLVKQLNLEPELTRQRCRAEKLTTYK